MHFAFDLFFVVHDTSLHFYLAESYNLAMPDMYSTNLCALSRYIHIFKYFIIEFGSITYLKLAFPLAILAMETIS